MTWNRLPATNPLVALTVGRRIRSRGLVYWVVALVLAAGGLGLGSFGLWSAVMPPPPRLMSVSVAFGPPGVLPAWLPAVRPDQLFVIVAGMTAFLILTVAGTLPQAALAFVRARERQILDAILLTRLSASSIFWASLADVLVTPALATLALLPVICLSFSMGGIPVSAMLAALGLLLLWQLLFAMLGLCVSAWSRRSVVAMLLAYLCFLLVCGGPLLVWPPGGAGVQPAWMDAVLALNPTVALVTLIAPQALPFARCALYPLPVLSGIECTTLSLLCFGLGVAGLRRR